MGWLFFELLEEVLMLWGVLFQRSGEGGRVDSVGGVGGNGG